MSQTITMDTFLPLIEENFSVHLGDKTIPATLLEVTPLGEPEDSGERSGWSMVFQFPPHQLYNQGIYEFEHAGIGSLAIFVVPIGEDSDGVRYQAIFN